MKIIDLGKISVKIGKNVNYSILSNLKTSEFNKDTKAIAFFNVQKAAISFIMANDDKILFSSKIIDNDGNLIDLKYHDNFSMRDHWNLLPKDVSIIIN